MGTGPTFARHRAVALVAAIAAGAMVASAVSAATPTELREERKAVQAEAAEAAAELDTLAAELEDIEAAWEVARGNVESQQAAVEDANRAVADALLAQVRAEQAIVELEAQQEQARLDLQAAAVENYVSFQGFGDLEVLGEDPWGATRAETLAEFGTGSGLEGLDDLRAISAELDFQRELAAQAIVEAETLRTEMELRLAELDTALLLEQELLDATLLRQDTRLLEAQLLSELEADLSEQIRVEEQRIADAIADRLPPGGGSVVIPPGTDIELTTVQGITVNVLIAEQVEGLLAAMRARGIDLGGGGYRSIESQIRLRRANCGTSDYAIWEMPASRCRPPTARPGLSQHELGLAIDFTVNGRVIRSRDSAAFIALKEIAADFGFFNLPSEPWHWSTTGG